MSEAEIKENYVTPALGALKAAAGLTTAMAIAMSPALLFIVSLH